MVPTRESFPLHLSAVMRFLYETMTMILSFHRDSVRHREVFTTKHICYREFSLHYAHKITKY